MKKKLIIGKLLSYSGQVRNKCSSLRHKQTGKGIKLKLHKKATTTTTSTTMRAEDRRCEEIEVK